MSSSAAAKLSPSFHCNKNKLKVRCHIEDEVDCMSILRYGMVLIQFNVPNHRSGYFGMIFPVNDLDGAKTQLNPFSPTLFF